MTDRHSVYLAFVYCLILAGTLAAQIAVWPHYTDDAYITLRYAARFLAGDGLTFNNGEAVEGFSNPLWLFLIIGFAKVTTIDLVTTSKILGLFAMAGVVAALWRIGRATGLAWLFPLGVGLVAATPGVQVYATLGMEVPLLMALLCWGTAFALTGTFGGLALGAFCMGLACITRPEGILYAALWGMVVAIFWLKPGVTPARLRKLALLGALTLAPFICYLLLRLHVYGAWLPNTAIAKMPGMWGFMSQSEEWLPFAIPLLILAAISIKAKPQLNNTRLVFLGLALAAFSACAAFSLYAGADWMSFGRFLLPAWPLVITAAALPFASLLERSAKRGLLLLCFLCLYAVYGLLSAVPYMSNAGLSAMLMRGSDQAVLGQWLASNFPTPLSIGVGRLGGVSYFAPQHSFHDWFGLTDAPQARAIRAAWPDISVYTITAQNPIIQQQPDMLLVHRNPRVFTPLYSAEELAVLQPNYTCLRQFPQGNWGSFDVWVKPALASAALQQRCTL